MIDKFHRRGEAEVRGVASPAKSGASSHSGVSLVELMIAMLILALVCIAWLQIIGIQSARREARRREAVERLSGMMDAFLYCERGKEQIGLGNYIMVNNGGYVQFENKRDLNVVHPLFGGDTSSIGYQLVVCRAGHQPDADLFGNSWLGSPWLVGRLYDRDGKLEDAGKPFFVLPVCIGGEQ